MQQQLAIDSDFNSPFKVGRRISRFFRFFLLLSLSKSVESNEPVQVITHLADICAWKRLVYLLLFFLLSTLFCCLCPVRVMAANLAKGITVQLVAWMLSAGMIIILCPFLLIFWAWSLVTDYSDTVKRKSKSGSKGWRISRGWGISRYVQLKVFFYHPVFFSYLE